jgi:hypothetical protein
MGDFERKNKWLPMEVFDTDVENVFVLKISKHYMAIPMWMSLILLAIRSAHNGIYNYSIEDYLCSLSCLINNTCKKEIINALYRNVRTLNRLVDNTKLKGRKLNDVHSIGIGNLFNAYRLYKTKYVGKKCDADSINIQPEYFSVVKGLERLTG